jgi:hypothetical protein
MRWSDWVRALRGDPDRSGLTAAPAEWKSLVANFAMYPGNFTTVPHLPPDQHCSYETFDWHKIDRPPGRSRPAAIDKLVSSIRKGSQGKWGAVPMPPNTGVNDEQAQSLALWVTDCDLSSVDIACEKMTWIGEHVGTE